MPGRLQELDAEDAADLADRLRAAVKGGAVVVVYAYGDWLQKGGLVPLVAASGLDGSLEGLVVTDAAEAAVWRP